MSRFNFPQKTDLKIRGPEKIRSSDFGKFLFRFGKKVYTANHQDLLIAKHLESLINTGVEVFQKRDIGTEEFPA